VRPQWVFAPALCRRARYCDYYVLDAPTRDFGGIQARRAHGDCSIDGTFQDGVVLATAKNSRRDGHRHYGTRT